MREAPVPDGVRLTAIICTRDRAAELRRTLDALADARVPDGLRWELLVVDNGSTDGTAEVAAGFRGRLPVRVVSEPRAGLSLARNRAVQEARGDALLWTDDDVTVGRGWIEAYVAAFATHAECGFFGGAIRAEFATGRPAWAEAAWSDVSRFWAVREPPGTDAAVTPDYVPYGANFAIRREVQRRYRYDPGLGRRPGDLRAGEEWDLLQRVLADGIRGRWVAAPVDHRIGADRATPAYVCRVARAIGRTGTERQSGGTGPRWPGGPPGLWSAYLRAGLRYAAARLSRDPARWVPLAIERARLRGRLDGARTIRGAGPGRTVAPGPGDPA